MISTERLVANLARGVAPPGPGLQIITTGAICAAQQPVPFTIDVYQDIGGNPDHLLRRGPLRSTMELDEAIARAWDGYSLEVFALLVPDGLPGAEGRLLWTMNWRDEGLTPSRALPVRQWARFGDAPIRAELLWLPADKPRQTISGDVQNASDSDLRRARAGVRLLQLTSLLDTVGGVLNRGGGRKKGDGATWRGGIPDFLEDLWDTIDRYRDKTGRSLPVITGKSGTTFRTMMREHPSERTLRDWLADASLRPQDIEQGKVTRANYSQFVAEQGA